LSGEWSGQLLCPFTHVIQIKKRIENPLLKGTQGRSDVEASLALEQEFEDIYGTQEVLSLITKPIIRREPLYLIGKASAEDMKAQKD
jgi:hypothetical protein